VVKLRFRDLAQIIAENSASAHEIGNIDEPLEQASDQGHGAKGKGYAEAQADARLSEVEKENAQLREEIEKWTLEKQSGLAKRSADQESMQQKAQSRLSEERSSFHEQMQERERSMELMLKKDQETTFLLEQALAQLADLRDQVDVTDDGRDNRLYELSRAMTVANDLNKEHSSALSIAAKKIIRLEDNLKVYKLTVKDVAKTLGASLNGIVTDPVTKEDLEAMHASVSVAEKFAALLIFFAQANLLNFFFCCIIIIFQGDGCNSRCFRCRSYFAYCRTNQLSDFLPGPGTSIGSLRCCPADPRSA
jgi:hypothetical protein